MLVEHVYMKSGQPTVLPRVARKRKARGGESHGSRERAAKISRRHQLPPALRITKPDPDEDSGLGFDEPPGCPLETASLLRAADLKTSVGHKPRRENGNFLHNVNTTGRGVQPPTTFLKGVNAVSKCGKYRLVLSREPEARHRARYQTEGSRGAVKDATGKTSPQVVLYGQTEPVPLQMFVGSESDGCAPHLFYQACRVTGKTASPSDELVLNGTVVIQTTMTPDPDATSVSARCDCLGILKQRNVDIESRVAAAAAGAGTAVSAGRRTASLRKGARTTSCRLVFRVTIVNGFGQTETLQIASRSIVCTQPQGVPEITKLSITEALCTGGQELILLGKNFVKDSRIVFSETTEGGATVWSETVAPHKDHIQPVHLVCEVPAYWDGGLAERRAVSVSVRSGDKESDAVPLTLLPAAELSQPLQQARRASADDGRLPNGVSHAAVAINRHFAETGEIVLGSGGQHGEHSVGQQQPAKPVPAPAAEELSAVVVPVVAPPEPDGVFVAVPLPAAGPEPVFQPVGTAPAWSPPQPAWSAPAAAVAVAEPAWTSPQHQVGQEAAPVQAEWGAASRRDVPAAQAVWSSPPQEPATQAAWSPQQEAEDITQAAWASPQPEAPIPTTVSEVWTQKPAEPVVESWPQKPAKSVQSWPQKRAKSLESWPQEPAKSVESWSQKPAKSVESWPVWPPLTKSEATAAESWATPAEPLATWAGMAAPKPALEQTWTALPAKKPAEDHAWPEQQPQQPVQQQQQPLQQAEQPQQQVPPQQPQQLQAWETAEVGSWTQQQLADVLTNSPKHAQDPAGRSDPMWGEAPTVVVTPGADDPLADMPRGMGLIEYINGDAE